MNLAPGNKLDKLVLDHVLKLTPCDQWVSDGAPMELTKVCAHSNGTCNPSWVVWKYSTEPGWAIVVRDWIVNNLPPHSFFSFSCVKPEVGDLFWRGTVLFGTGDSLRAKIAMQGRTLEHVCCLLALRMAFAPVDFTGYERSDSSSEEVLAEVLIQESLKEVK